MGFLDRLRGTVNANLNVHSTVKQNIAINVPAHHATAVQASLERWAKSKGWATVVKAENRGETVKLSLEHDETMPGTPPEIDAGQLSDELQQVVKYAIGDAT